MIDDPRECTQKYLGDEEEDRMPTSGEDDDVEAKNELLDTA